MWLVKHKSRSAQAIAVFVLLIAVTASWLHPSLTVWVPDSRSAICAATISVPTSLMPAVSGLAASNCERWQRRVWMAAGAGSQHVSHLDLFSHPALT